MRIVHMCMHVDGMQVTVTVTGCALHTCSTSIVRLLTAYIAYEGT